MPAAIVDLTIDQGSYWTVQLLWKAEDGTPIDLTSYTARMQVRHKLDSDVLVELTTTGGQVVLGGTAGTINLSLTDAITAALHAGVHVYDLEVVPPDGKVRRLIEGRITVSPEVTRG